MLFVLVLRVLHQGQQPQLTHSPCGIWLLLQDLQWTRSKPFLPLVSSRISNEHSPKLQIRSHSYLRAVSEVSINRSLDSLDPAGLLTSPKFRSRNESYMRAMSTISQVRAIWASVAMRHYRCGGGEARGPLTESTGSAAERCNVSHVFIPIS